MTAVNEDCDVETIGAFLEDATTRTILRKINDDPMTAQTLSDHCEASQPTVYRRLDDLRECGLLIERTKPDPVGGHHRTMYATDLQRIVILLEDDRIDLQIDRREDMADRFTRLIEGM